MKRLLQFTALLACALALSAAVAGATTRAAPPSITMEGNQGVCSLNARPHMDHSFRMELKNWPARSKVKIEVNYLDNGKAYPFRLKNDGVVHVDASGNHIGPLWTCWPVGTGAYAVNDRQTTYFVYAFRIGINKPLKSARATFRVAK